MAQTKRRRRTKHRGNAAGVVEVRGRTGRKPTAEERKKPDGTKTRANRYDQPPSWKSAFNRALIALVFFAVLVLFVLRPANKVVVLIWLPVMLLIYVPMGYYTDRWLYRRRQRQKAEGRVK